MGETRHEDRPVPCSKVLTYTVVCLATSLGVLGAQACDLWVFPALGSLGSAPGQTPRLREGALSASAAGR